MESHTFQEMEPQSAAGIPALHLLENCRQKANPVGFSSQNWRMLEVERENKHSSNNRRAVGLQKG